MSILLLTNGHCSPLIRTKETALRYSRVTPGTDSKPERAHS